MEPTSLVDAVRVEKDSVTVLEEKDLEVTVDFAGDTEVGTCNAGLELRAFHQHELAGDVLLIVYSLLAEVFCDFHGIKGI